MNPVLEAPLAIATPVAAVALLWLADRMVTAWHRAPVSPAPEAVPAEPAVTAARQYHGPSAADRIPYDSGPVICVREEP